MTDTDWYVYVAFPPDCRCISAVRIDESDYRRDVAEWILGMVDTGHLVERMRGDAFRVLPFRCEQHPEGRWR